MKGYLIAPIIAIALAGCGVDEVKDVEEEVVAEEATAEKMEIKTPKFDSLKDADEYLFELSRSRSWFEIQEYEDILAKETYVSSEVYKKYSDFCFYGKCEEMDFKESRNYTGRFMMFETRIDEEWLESYEAEWVAEDDTYKLVSITFN